MSAYVNPGALADGTQVVATQIHCGNLIATNATITNATITNANITNSAKYTGFYGLTAGVGSISNDYTATIAVHTTAGTGRVPFPRDGAATTGVVRIDGSSFTLTAAGTYEISFQVHTTEPGQLQLELNGTALAYTTATNANPTSGGHELVYSGFVTAPAGAVLAVINPATNPAALTVTAPGAAFANAAAQRLSIKLL